MLTVLVSIISCSQVFLLKLEMCPQYTDAPAVGYLTIKLQNSTWYKCLNLSLTGSRMYGCTYKHTFVQKDVHLYAHTHIRTYGKPKNYMPPASSDVATRIFSAKILAYTPYLMISFNDTFVSFEQLGPGTLLPT